MALTRPAFTRLRRRRQRAGLAPELQATLKTLKPGDVYPHPVAYSTDPLIGSPGFYATDPITHQIVPDLRLTVMPNLTGDPNDSNHLFVVADPKKPYYERLPQPEPLTPPNEVHLQARVKGTANVEHQV